MTLAGVVSDELSDNIRFGREMRLNLGRMVAHSYRERVLLTTRKSGILGDMRDLGLRNEL
jgi:hypothetical protein